MKNKLIALSMISLLLASYEIAKAGTTPNNNQSSSQKNRKNLSQVVDEILSKYNAKTLSQANAVAELIKINLIIATRQKNLLNNSKLSADQIATQKTSLQNLQNKVKTTLTSVQKSTN